MPATKGPTVGSGGRVRRGLEGKGPTPKAKDRPNHKAYKAASKPGGKGGARRAPTKARRTGEEPSGSPGATRWSRPCAPTCR